MLTWRSNRPPPSGDLVTQPNQATSLSWTPKERPTRARVTMATRARARVGRSVQAIAQHIREQNNMNLGIHSATAKKTNRFTSEYWRILFFVQYKSAQRAHARGRPWSPAPARRPCPILDRRKLFGRGRSRARGGPAPFLVGKYNSGEAGAAARAAPLSRPE